MLLRAVVCSSLIAIVGGMQADTAIRTIDRGVMSNVDAKREVVARTEAEFAALWKSHSADKPAPKIDFSKDMVVGVFMGSRPTGGYVVEIVSASIRGGALVVGYRETSPGRGAIAAQVLTSPYHIAAVPKRAGDVKFEKM